jgi:hypothetical protein
MDVIDCAIGTSGSGLLRELILPQPGHDSFLVFFFHLLLTPTITMSFLVQGLAALSAFQPKPPTLEYDGLEYRWKMLTFRPAEYKLEAALFAAVGIYLLFYFAGRTYNMSRARHMYVQWACRVVSTDKQLHALPVSLEEQLHRNQAAAGFGPISTLELL